MLFIIITSCSNKNYYGYVYDFDQEAPIEGVLITDSLSNIKTKTNSEGYFELRKEKLSSDYLIFSKKNYHSAKIRTISIQNGETMKESFKGEKIFIIQKNSKTKNSRLNVP